MEVLARELLVAIDTMCYGFHYYKDENILEPARNLSEKIQQYCGAFLQGNQYGMEEEEYLQLKNYILLVLQDYVEALEQRDIVLMLDTLDFGLRQLINIYIDDTTGAENDK